MDNPRGPWKSHARSRHAPAIALMTGHADGLITINAKEADDAQREQIKYALREPYRALVGHFRHEVAKLHFIHMVIADARMDADI